MRKRRLQLVSLDQASPQSGCLRAPSRPRPGADRSAANAVSELKPDDPPPDFEFNEEDRRRVRFSDVRGRALAFTFSLTSGRWSSIRKVASSAHWTASTGCGESLRHHSAR